MNKIFEECAEELSLQAGGYNLLKNPNNCIESAMVIGYIIEEYIVSKLELCLKKHNVQEIKMERIGYSTQKASYDFT